jgi:hypothetical protein
MIAYPDADLPATVNSVAALDGYLIFTDSVGARIWATGLNTTDGRRALLRDCGIAPDALVRGIAFDGRFYAMGGETIEVWVDEGLSPVPAAALLERHSGRPPNRDGRCRPRGGWGTPLFVAHDSTVRILDGFETKKVSTPDVERFITSSTTSTLEACVYTFGGHSIWSLSSNLGTWEYDLSTGAWHERVSVGATRWRGSRSVKANGKWLVGDTLSGALLAIDDTVRTEKGAALNPVFSSGR